MEKKAGFERAELDIQAERGILEGSTCLFGRGPRHNTLRRPWRDCVLTHSVSFRALFSAPIEEACLAFSHTVGRDRTELKKVRDVLG